MQSINLTTAFVVTQFMLLALTFLGILMLRAGEGKYHSLSILVRPATRLYPALFAGFSLITLGLLIFSHDVLASSLPVFGGLKLPSLDRDTSFLAVFALNLIGSAILIGLTGGAQLSPFSSMLFVLPTLAIFLRESPQRFLSYAFVAAVLFLFVQTDSEDTTRNPYQRRAFFIVNLGCLGISTMIGYATRPL